MNNFFVFNGPKNAFIDYLNESHVLLEESKSLSELARFDDDLRNNRQNVTEFITKDLVIFSDEYASVNEHVLLNFDKFFLPYKIENIYLHNPPRVITEKLEKKPSLYNLKKYEYQPITDEYIYKLFENYDKEIIGQSKAKRNLLISILPLIRTYQKKPVVILLYGPSGVGKTESAKIMSKYLGGLLFRKQLSMFQNNDFATYLFGGRHNDNSFAKELLERETNIILLDEFDKANQFFYSAFYQMFDEGIFEDKNYKVDLGCPIIICTSNYLSSNEIRNHLGDPIFSRFDSCIKFNDLSPEDIKTIIKLRINQEFKSLNENDQKQVSIEKIESQFINNITNFNNARRLGKLIRESFFSQIYDNLLSNK